MFDALVSLIIEDLGGQVVRLGHPEMTRFEPRAGFVDLAFAEDSFLLQATAVSRARFHLATPSGTATFSSALGTPHAHVCEVETVSPALYGDMHVLCSHLVTAEGQRISNRALHSRIFAGDRRKEELVTEFGFRIVHNSVEELVAMAKHMLVATRDQLGWRVPSAPDLPPPPNRLVLPFPETSVSAPVVEFPELAPQLPVIDMREPKEQLLPFTPMPRLDKDWSGD